MSDDKEYIAPFVTDVRVLPDIALNEKAVRHIYERDRNAALVEALKKALGHLDMISPSGWHVEQARSTIIKALEDAGS